MRGQNCARSHRDAHRVDGGEDVVGLEGDVLDALAAVLLEVREDLRLALRADRRLVHRQQHALVVRREHLCRGRGGVSELRAELRAESGIARTIELRPESTVPTSSAVNSANSWKPVMPPM